MAVGAKLTLAALSLRKEHPVPTESEPGWMSNHSAYRLDSKVSLLMTVDLEFS